MPHSSTSSQSGLSTPRQGPTRSAKDPATARLVLVGGRLSWSWLCSSPVPVEHGLQEQSPLSSLQSGPPASRTELTTDEGPDQQLLHRTCREQASPRASGQRPPASQSPRFLPRTQGPPKRTQMSPPAFDSLPSDNQRPRPGWGHLGREGPLRRNREVDGTPGCLREATGRNMISRNVSRSPPVGPAATRLLPDKIPAASSSGGFLAVN